MAKSRKKSKGTRIDLVDPLTILHEHITEEACEEAFQSTRKTERRRLWTLHALVEFWTAVIIYPPKALRHALELARQDSETRYPYVESTPEAFFERCQTFRWEFFARVFERFIAAILPEAPLSFCSKFHYLRERFPEVWVWDGSRLDPIRKRLKILRDVTATVLPGCLLCVYDLFRGIPRIVKYEMDAAKSEMKRIWEILTQIPEGTLILGDRLSASVQLFAALTEKKLYGLFRYNKCVTLVKGTLFSSAKRDGGVLEDWEVEAGTGATAEPQVLRYICFRKGKRVARDVLTNVMDPEMLTAEEAIDLYYCRWSIERMFYDLKVVFNLHRFYAANPNAVGMQVYSAFLVYTAMRICQAMAARQVQVEPEDISTEKFFPRVASASHKISIIQETMCHVHVINPGKKIQDLSGEYMGKHFRGLTTTLEEVRVEKRNEHRRKRRFCKGRRKWKSFKHIPGGPTLIKRGN
jgi:hypothetical protein